MIRLKSRKLGFVTNSRALMLVESVLKERAQMPDDIPLFSRLEDPEYRSWLISLRRSVAPILANNLLPHFTDHSVTHSDSLTSLVDDLTVPLQGRERLSQREAVVLYAACYLHDVGMQYETAGETAVVQRRMAERGIVQRWVELPEATRRDLLRECHPEIAVELVVASVRNATPPIGIQFPEEFNPGAVAALCHSHGVDAPSPLYERLTQEAPGLRMKLLAGLLRMADILDESRRRAQRGRARTLDLDLVSQMHWWRHYYTEAVTFDAERRVITLWFDFPSRLRAEYARFVPELQFPEIQNELERHLEVFTRHGCSWSVRTQVHEGLYGIAEEMPTGVEVAMLREVAQRQEQQESAQRLAILETLSEARGMLERRLSEIRRDEAGLVPAERLRQVAGIAEELWGLRARRSARMLLAGDYERHLASLSVSDRFRIGSRLAWMQLEDGDAVGSAQTLHELQAIADAPETDMSERLSFLKLQARALSTVGAYEETVQALIAALELEKDPREHENLLARIAEEHLLHGNLDLAIGFQRGNEEDER